MTAISRQRKIVDDFRSESESNYIFACQAAVPLVFTPDLLYHLWNNFKQYHYIFDPRHYYKISHLAVSDLLLSGLCKEVGFELYEIEKDIRDTLLEDLVLNVGKKRKNTIAAFLEDYALLEHRHAHRKDLKDIHLLTALSVLNPSEMERQIIERINEAKTDAEKINYLLLHKNLLPLGYDSELGKISKAIPSIKNSKTFSPILILEEDPNAPDVLNVKLPAVLSSKIRKINKVQKEFIKDNQSLALQLIRQSIETGNSTLDLGNCGLSDEDFALSTPIGIALRQCIHLRALILSNAYIDPPEAKWKESQNGGKKNKITKLPLSVATLNNLEKLVCSGEPRHEWQIQDLNAITGLTNLEYLDLSYNQISDISALGYLPSLQQLNLNYNQISDISVLRVLTGLKQLLLEHNQIKKIDEISDLSELQLLDLRSNQIDDVSPLLTLLEREKDQMQVICENASQILNNAILLFDNPITTPPIEIVNKGTKAIFNFFKGKKKQEPGQGGYVGTHGYIKGYTYDIFMSYAHIDNQILFHEKYGWIEEFYDELNLLLTRKIGIANAIKFWWDNKKLDGSIEFNSYIDESIKQSAILICLTSPAYLKSQYCQKELQSFYNKALHEPIGLYLGNRSRIINVLINNIPYTQWPHELIGTTGFKFNDANGVDDFGNPYEINSIEFRNSMKELRDAIIKLIEEFETIKQQAVYTGKFTIFFGDVSDSLRLLKKRTIAELKARDFEVISDMPPPYEESEHENLINEKLKQVQLSVHLLDQYPGREIEGKQNLSYPQKQVELALQSPVTQLIWTPLEMKLEDVEEEDYKHFLQNLETGNLPNKEIKFIHGIKSELTKQIIDISSTLPMEEKKPSKERITVLLVTHYDDQLYALEISKQLIESGIQPYISPEEDDSPKNIIILAERVSKADKIIFFYGKVSYDWISEMIKSVLQLVVAHKLLPKDFCIYILPTHKDTRDLSSFDNWSVPIKIVDNSDSLQQFLKS